MAFGSGSGDDGLLPGSSDSEFPSGIEKNMPIF